MEASALGSTTDVLLIEARPGLCTPEAVPASSALPPSVRLSSTFREFGGFGSLYAAGDSGDAPSGPLRDRPCPVCTKVFASLASPGSFEAMVGGFPLESESA